MNLFASNKLKCDHMTHGIHNVTLKKHTIPNDWQRVGLLHNPLLLVCIFSSRAHACATKTDPESE